MEVHVNGRLFSITFNDYGASIVLAREHNDCTSYHGHVVNVEVLYPNVFPTVNTRDAIH